MSIANIADVAATLGRDITAEEEVRQVNAWISLAGRLIAKRLGPLDRLDAENLRAVVAEVVARRVRNPDGLQSERIDDYSMRLSDDAARVGLYLTAEEWDLLTPDGAGAETASYSIRPVARPYIAPRVRGWSPW